MTIKHINNNNTIEHAQAHTGRWAQGSASCMNSRWSSCQPGTSSDQLPQLTGRCLREQCRLCGSRSPVPRLARHRSREPRARPAARAQLSPAPPGQPLVSWPAALSSGARMCPDPSAQGAPPSLLSHLPPAGVGESLSSLFCTKGKTSRRQPFFPRGPVLEMRRCSPVGSG